MKVVSLLNQLVDYAVNCHLISSAQRESCKRKLYELWHLPVDDMVFPVVKTTSLQGLLSELSQQAVAAKLIQSNQCEYFETEMMNVFSHSRTELDQAFRKDYLKSPQLALDNFYKYCCDINYIKTAAIAKNQHFDYQDADIKLEITINLSKPEKDPKAIAAALQQPVLTIKGAPKCDLCKENEGYTNHFDKNKQTLRLIPLTLAGEDWYFQYSPYAYFYQHSIVLDGRHVPMHISDQTIVQLLEFVDRFPGFLIGTNADLPIVGGSILSHNHYQCGNHRFPLEQAQTIQEFKQGGVTYAILQWPLSTIRLEGSNVPELIKCTNQLVHRWHEYSNEALGIKNSQTEQHNTVNLIVRHIDTKYVVYVMLRNNCTTSRYPDGVFHVHPEHFNIKKENIGLIEALGLAILPPRLVGELDKVGKCLKGDQTATPEYLGNQYNWYLQLKSKFKATTNLDAFLKQAVGYEFKCCLENCGVFNNHNHEFIEFMKEAMLCIK